MHKNSLKKTAFKTCGTCDTGWITRSEFIGCRSISLVGYQSNFERIEEGLFLFNHTIESCGSTISVQVGKFMPVKSIQKRNSAEMSVSADVLTNPTSNDATRNADTLMSGKSCRY
jgi:hypothetical protein